MQIHRRETNLTGSFCHPEQELSLACTISAPDRQRVRATISRIASQPLFQEQAKLLMLTREIFPTPPLEKRSYFTHNPHDSGRPIQHACPCAERSRELLEAG